MLKDRFTICSRNTSFSIRGNLGAGKMKGTSDYYTLCPTNPKMLPPHSDVTLLSYLEISKRTLENQEV
jgi:hypothetical protein